MAIPKIPHLRALTRSLEGAVILCLVSGYANAAPAAAKTNQVKVTLFGQPCLMTGPYSADLLAQIHAISPEKLPPDMTVAAMKAARTRAVALKGVAGPIETYRDHLRKRLSAKIAFEEAISEAKKGKATQSSLRVFLQNVKEHVATPKYVAFDKETQTLFEKNAFKWNEYFVAPLRERYETVIEPDTEEEFHKAIRVAQVQYVCALDEVGGSGEDDSEE